MTHTPDIETHIDARITRLARGRRSREAQAELRDHVLHTARDRAGDDTITQADIDAAFATLGDDATIRDTFFPGTPRVPLRGHTIAVLVGAALLVVLGHLVGTNGGTATCTVADGGTCSATSGGAVLDLLLMATPPLLVLAARAWLPAWPAVTIGLGGGIVYLFFAVMRATVPGEPLIAVAELLAAAAVVAAAGQHIVLQRRAVRA